MKSMGAEEINLPCVRAAVGDRKLYYYTVSHEFRAGLSRLLFASEDLLCANLRVQEQSTNMTSLCQCLAFA